VLSPNGKEWQYVRPRPECAVINLGDAFVKMVGGRLHSAVHRVVGPPGEQSMCERHSVVYFSRPNTDVLLRSLFEDPKKRQLEVDENGEKLMNADEWVAQRARNWNKGNYKDASSYKASRGTEHNNVAILDKPPMEIEAV